MSYIFTTFCCDLYTFNTDFALALPRIMSVRNNTWIASAPLLLIIILFELDNV
uniref:Uncharacterized protein n=1 Tax=Arundo donax TaxID=35708 RepID=A0A0A9BMM6_ARUDO